MTSGGYLAMADDLGDDLLVMLFDRLHDVRLDEVDVDPAHPGAACRHFVATVRGSNQDVFVVALDGRLAYWDVLGLRQHGKPISGSTLAEFDAWMARWMARGTDHHHHGHLRWSSRPRGGRSAARNRA